MTYVMVFLPWYEAYMFKKPICQELFELFCDIKALTDRQTYMHVQTYRKGDHYRVPALITVTKKEVSYP